jgi:uncharacterized protein with HEPN domain
MRDYNLYLKDILAAIESIEAFVDRMSFDEFIADDRTISAVIRKFEVIGEATKQIPDDLRQRYPEIPWKEMAGNGNVISAFPPGFLPSEASPSGPGDPSSLSS